MTDLFGDIERADAWDEDPTVDPLQVARRLHRLRTEVDQLAGIIQPSWRDLPETERDAAETLGRAIRDWIANHEPDTPGLLARHVHDVRVLMSGGTVRDWDDLSPDERQIGIDLVDLIIDWLDTEGPR
jgi:hypothetical protein